MKGTEWMRFCIENRTSEKQKRIMLVRRINVNHEKRLYRIFKDVEADLFVGMATDITRRRKLMFAVDDGKGSYFFAHYCRKERRFTHLMYSHDDSTYGSQYIFLKHSIFANTD